MQNNTTVSENKQKSNMRSRMGRPTKGKGPAPTEPSPIGEVDVKNISASPKPARAPQQEPKPVKKETQKTASSSQGKPLAEKSEHAPRRESQNRSGQHRSEGANTQEESGRNSGPRRRRPRRPSSAREDISSAKTPRQGGNRSRVEEHPVVASSNEIYYEPPRRKKDLSKEKPSASTGQEKGWVKTLLSSVFGFGSANKAAQPKAEARESKSTQSASPRFMEGEKPHPRSRSRGSRGRGRGRGPSSPRPSE